MGLILFLFVLFSVGPGMDCTLGPIHGDGLGFTPERWRKVASREIYVACG